MDEKRRRESSKAQLACYDAEQMRRVPLCFTGRGFDAAIGSPIPPWAAGPAGPPSSPVVFSPLPMVGGRKPTFPTSGEVAVQDPQKSAGLSLAGAVADVPSRSDAGVRSGFMRIPRNIS